MRNPGPFLHSGGLLLVSLATCLVLAAAAHPSPTPVQRLLSARPLVALGLVSYGVYLWHWPVFVAVTPARTGLSGPGLLIARVVLTLVAATLSYLLVERPARRVDLSGLDPAIRALLLPASAAACLAAVTVAALVPAPSPEGALTTSGAPASAT